ncbi:MAG: oxidoreductase, partial [Eudoraea sp.]|nr:oxidoreductase [Eudoraea sp.]
SIIITRDGGHTWAKVPCTVLPPALEGEGAFAASNTNVAIDGDKAWIATTKSRIFFTPDKGRSWEVLQTPVVHGKETEGIYSIAFYNAELGFVIGGDYTKAEVNTGNKAITRDGGASWELVAEGMDPGYKSCVQFVPNSGGQAIVALGYTGISHSSDAGANWKMLSPESFYTLRFLNDSVAYAAGKNRIAKLIFK